VPEHRFFSELGKESGFSEHDLRSVFDVANDGNVNLLTPSRGLGANRAEQARTVIVLIAGARAHGLGERPVNLDSVRAVVQRKNCYDSKKFVSDDLGGLKGFRPGSKGYIVVTPRWLDEFKPAIDRVLGHKPSVGE
jgi:hypothetical protein